MTDTQRYDRDWLVDTQEPTLIPCGGTVIHAYGIEEKLQRAMTRETILFDDGSPEIATRHIGSVSIIARRGETEGGQEGLVLQGKIGMKDPMSGTLMAKIFGHREPTPFARSAEFNRSVNISRHDSTDFFNMRHVLGLDFMMRITRDRTGIFVQNHWQDLVEEMLYRPVEPDTMSRLAQFTGFAACFMHTLDFVSNLDKQEPAKGFRRASIAITRPLEDEAVEVVEAYEDYDDEPEIVTLDDIVGLDHQVGVMRKIARSYEIPDSMRRWRARRPNGILLYGPQGGGKTMMFEALGHEIGAEVRHIQSNDIYKKFTGESEDSVKAIFEEARTHEGRLILFFDEIDSIFGRGTAGGSSEIRASVAGLVKQEMNYLTRDNPNVLVGGATNDKNLLDPALIRSGRFDYQMQVPELSLKTMMMIFEKKIAKDKELALKHGVDKYADRIDFGLLAGMLVGRPGSDVGEALRRASFDKALDEADERMVDPLATVTPITQAYIEERIREMLRE